MVISSIFAFDGIIFLAIGLLFFVFSENMMELQKKINKKFFDIGITYTKKTIKIMKWYFGIPFIILGVLFILLSFYLG
jgi:hypothetical protein